MLHYMLKKLRKEHILNKTSQKYSTLIIIVKSATGHMTLAGIHNFLPQLIILYFFHPLQAPQQILVLFPEE